MIYVIPRGEMQRDKPRFFDSAVTASEEAAGRHKRGQIAICKRKGRFIVRASASFRYGQRNVRRKARWARMMMMMIRAYLRTRFYEARPSGRRQMTREYLLTPSPFPREGAMAPCLLFHKKGHKRETLHLAGGKFGGHTASPLSAPGQNAFFV